MPRRGRVFVEGLIYHVYNRVGRGEAPFELDIEPERAIERWGVGVKAFGDVLGKSRDGVSKWVRWAARRRSEDGGFAQRLDKLDRRLAAGFEK